MSIPKKKELSPDIQTAAVCGLFCPSCTLYIGTLEEPSRLELLSRQFGRTISELKCKGCRSDQVSFYCKACSFKKCASERNIEFCGECSDYPCGDLKSFQREMPHRAELWKSLEQIKTEGWKKWFTDMAEKTSCPSCSTINSAYDLSCRSCSHQPSSSFAEKHADEILNHLNSLRNR